MKKFSNVKKINAQSLALAAEILRKGGIVAFPTETVYGLGANALDADAVKKIFQAKGRPGDNPLIVHIANQGELHLVTKNIPDVARVLMKKFWPGPLTFVLQKNISVPDIVTAGGSTVAVRMPKHPVALSLIKKAGCPIAAPSANLAGKPSPTSAVHVHEDLGTRVDLILDGGLTQHGVESTVIDVTRKKVEILRSGAVTAEMLQKVLGYKPKIHLSHEGSPSKNGSVHRKIKVRSPGLKYRHYAPSVKLYLVTSEQGSAMVKLIRQQIVKSKKKGLRTGVLCSTEHKKFYGDAHKVVVCGSQKNLAQIARKLFSSLRNFHPKDVDIIIAENFPNTGIGHAIMDKLSRAATKKI